MFREADAAVRLSEYRPYDWLVDTVDLDFRLEPTSTRVRAKLAMLVTLSVLVSLTQLPAAEKSVCV